MEKGIIFTKDKKDIEVFFLKPQSPRTLMETDFLPPMGVDGHPLPWGWPETNLNETGYAHDSEGVLKEIKGCCPSGHKGTAGTVGVREDEADILKRGLGVVFFS